MRRIIYVKNIKEDMQMPENNINCQNQNNHCCCQGNGGIFGGDSEILFFIIIFLLLFTSFGYGR